MLRYHCHHCERLVSAKAAPAGAVCTICQNALTNPEPGALVWFVGVSDKEHGPYSWQQLLILAARGAIDRSDMLLQQGADYWIRAGALPGLFNAPAVSP